jgi:hypothetical protein
MSDLTEANFPDLVAEISQDDFPDAYFRHMSHIRVRLQEAMAEKKLPEIEGDPDSWAGMAVGNFGYLDPEMAWVAIDRLIGAALTADDIGSVGAGPLEDLMKMWGGAFADRLVEKVRDNVRWAYAASVVRGAAGVEDAVASTGLSWSELDAAVRAGLRRDAAT